MLPTRTTIDDPAVEFLRAVLVQSLVPGSCMTSLHALAPAGTGAERCTATLLMTAAAASGDAGSSLSVLGVLMPDSA